MSTKLTTPQAQPEDFNKIEVKLSDADLLYLGNEQKRYKATIGMATVNRDQAFQDYIALVAVRKNVKYDSSKLRGVTVDPDTKKAQLLLSK